MAGVALAVAVLCGLPYLLSALFGPPALQRIGTFWFVRDFSQYQAAMREGARQTSWLVHDHFSAEPHATAFMYPLYVGVGKLAAVLGLNDLALFTTLEWLGRLSLVAAVYVFTGTFLKARRQRRLAVLLTLGTLGVDVWALPIRLLLDTLGLHDLASLLPDTINPYLEVNSFGVLLSAPHLMFGLALTLLSAPVYLRAIGGSRICLVGLGATMICLSVVHPFNTPVVVSVLGLHAVLRGCRAWPAAIVAGLAAAPTLVYSLLLYQHDPFWSGTYNAQNLMPSPPIWGLPFDFGVVMLVAPLAWRIVRGWPTDRRWLIVLWVAIGCLWMYAPVPYQRRFGFGVQPALAVLAAAGLLDVQAWMGAHRMGSVWPRLVNYSALVAGISTSVFVYVALLSSAVLNAPAAVYLWSRSEAAAAAWLGEHSTPEDVVMASTEFANPLAGAIDGRVVYGHVVGTLHNTQKEALVHEFYAADTSVQQRQDLLDQSHATLVALGPDERALGSPDLNQDPKLDLIYARDDIELFRVLP